MGKVMYMQTEKFLRSMVYLCGICILATGCCIKAPSRPRPIGNQLWFEKNEIASRSWRHEGGQQISLLKLEYLSFSNRPTLAIATYAITGDPRIRCIDFYRCVPMRDVVSPIMELLAHDVASDGWFDSFHVRTPGDAVVVDVLGINDNKEAGSISSYQYSYGYEKGGKLSPGISLITGPWRKSQ